jgi:hypothetical protein
MGFATAGFSASDSRALVDCEADRSFAPSAARAPAARISSSVSVAAADFFSRAFNLRGAGVGDSEATCSEGTGVSVERSGFFSRATITSWAWISATKIMLQSAVPKSRFSMMAPDKRVTPFTSPRS